MSLTRLEQRGDVGILWMSDEKRRNALSTGLVRELLDGLEASRRGGIRAIVVASDQKAFSAGADIRDMLDNNWLSADPKQRSVIVPPDLFEAIESDPRPILAAVDSLALGGGVELCLACDLLIAGPQAGFLFPELGLGVLPNTAIARLPALIGQRAAADLILTRRKVGADEALKLGLATKIVSEGSVVDHAVSIASNICASSPPAALAAAKRNLVRGRNWPAVHAMLADMSEEEWREGVGAFLEKRGPDYDRFWKAIDRK